MKLTEMKTEDLVTIVAHEIAGSIADDSQDDIRNYIMDVETGKSKPVCTWTREELIEELLIDDAECFGCSGKLTLEAAYVTDDNSHDLVCEFCHND